MRRLVQLLCIFVIGFTAARAIADTGTITDVDLGLVDRAESLWRSGAIPAALILVAFVLLKFLRARIVWLQTGHAATWIAAAIGALGMLVQTVANGLTPNASMIMVAAVTALSIAQDPKHDAPVPPGGYTGGAP